MKKPSWISEFKDFISRGNVIDLAVGVVIGGAFTAIVNGVVDSIINPIITLISGQTDFDKVTVGIFPIGTPHPAPSSTSSSSPSWCSGW